MRKKTLTTLGAVFLFTGCLLAMASALTTGINDSEWGHLSKTGGISTPEKLIWSEWRPNDGSVTIFRQYHPQEEFGPVTNFRVSHTHGILFDFTAYEAQCLQSNHVVTVPAHGPNWGASYRREWMFMAFGIGAILIVSSVFVRRHSPA